MTVIRRAAPALLAAAALVLAGCGAGGGGRTGGAPATPSAVRAVLDDRAAAVRDHDRAAFLRTVGPGGFRAAQDQVFTNLRRLPLSAFAYRRITTGAFPVAGPGEAAVHAELDWGLRGYDAVPVVAQVYLTLRRTGGRWVVVSQTGGGPSGHRTDVQPWDLGPLTVVRGARSLVLGQAGAAQLRACAGLADRAVPAVDRAWPGTWAHRAVLVVPGSEADLAALLDAPPAAYAGTAAVTTAELRGTGRAPADRILVNPHVFAGLSALGRQVVVTHELTHVATRTATTSRTPLWLSEGFADLAGWRGTGRTPAEVAPELADRVRAGRVPAALPAAGDFGPGGGGAPRAYEGGWLACRLIAERWGTGRLTAFYTAAGRQGAGAAFAGVLGTDTDRFTADWRAYLREQLA